MILQLNFMTNFLKMDNRIVFETRRRLLVLWTPEELAVDDLLLGPIRLSCPAWVTLIYTEKYRHMKDNEKNKRQWLFWCKRLNGGKKTEFLICAQSKEDLLSCDSLSLLCTVQFEKEVASLLTNYLSVWTFASCLFQCKRKDKKRVRRHSRVLCGPIWFGF